MTVHSFQCPSCGAPLMPKGAASLISCPHCDTSVVVPEELRQALKNEQWTTLVYDNFSTNDNNWLVGNQGGEYFSKQSLTIADGRYRWEAETGRPNSIAPSWLRGYPVSDFHITVNCKHISGSKSGSSSGLIFRIQDNHNYYSFRITDQQFFAVSVVKDDKWSMLVDWTRSEAIKPNGVNQIEVIAHGSHFIFLINGQVVQELDDDHFSKGLVGLAIEGYAPGGKIIYDFIDITLRERNK
jgi:predicted RNA-binding Zn-ribbon protein involved in translation (DUF1610 family)